MRVLVVDDEYGIRGLMSIMLNFLGHEPILAENGQEAVKRYSCDIEGFDLVITDLNMPVMDGHETVRQIRQMNPNARIVCMSANCAADPPPDIPFFEKPFTLATLRLCIHVAMAGGQLLRKAG